MNRLETNPEMALLGEVAVEKLVYGGMGLARLEGKTVFIPHVLPGESVRIEIVREKPGLIYARLVEVLSQAAGRITPLCPYFRRCGGCHYQHVEYGLQLSLKVEVFKEVLRRIAKLDPPEQIRIFSGQPWGYRNRAQFHFAAGRLGYLEAGSHKLCPVDQCPISSPKINEVLRVLHEMIAEDSRFPHFVSSIELFTNERDVQLNVLETRHPVARRFFDWCAERIPGFIDGCLDYPGSTQIYRVGPRSFFQVNRFLIDKLAETVVGSVEGDTAIELYAGVGLYSLSLARRFRQLRAVESSRGAAKDLEFNAARAGVCIEVRCEPAEKFLASATTAPDFILMDPPRSGIGKTVLQHLCRLRPRLLTIVSCNPATLSRDLAVLTAAGYRLERIDLIDLFPQTFHIEAVVHLRLN